MDSQESSWFLFMKEQSVKTSETALEGRVTQVAYSEQLPKT